MEVKFGINGIMNPQNSCLRKENSNFCGKIANIKKKWLLKLPKPEGNNSGFLSAENENNGGKDATLNRVLNLRPWFIKQNDGYFCKNTSVLDSHTGFEDNNDDFYANTYETYENNVAVHCDTPNGFDQVSVEKMDSFEENQQTLGDNIINSLSSLKFNELDCSTEEFEEGDQESYGSISTSKTSPSSKRSGSILKQPGHKKTPIKHVEFLDNDLQNYENVRYF